MRGTNSVNITMVMTSIGMTGRTICPSLLAVVQRLLLTRDISILVFSSGVSISIGNSMVSRVG